MRREENRRKQGASLPTSESHLRKGIEQAKYFPLNVRKYRNYTLESSRREIALRERGKESSTRGQNALSALSYILEKNLSCHEKKGAFAAPLLIRQSASIIRLSRTLRKRYDSRGWARRPDSSRRGQRPARCRTESWVSSHRRPSRSAHCRRAY